MEASRQEQNLELARAAVDAYNRGDIQWVLEHLDPEVEVFSTPELVNAGTYRGRDGFLKWMEQWVEAWESFQIELQGLTPVGKRYVIADVRQFGRGAGSGVEVELDASYLWEVEGGIATRLHLYVDHEAAAAALERLDRGAGQSA